MKLEKKTLNVPDITNMESLLRKVAAESRAVEP